MVVGSSTDSPSVRLLRRSDLAALTELRRRFHVAGAAARAPAPLADDMRARIATTTSAFWENDAVVVYVAQARTGASDEGGRGPLVGYALGRCAVWPPIWRTQRVGEIVETYVDPVDRAPEFLEALISAMTAELSRRDVEVLRARVASCDRGTRTRFEAIGFTPLLRTFVRSVELPGPGGDSIQLRPARAADIPSLVLLSLAMLEENGRHEPRLTPHADAPAGLAERHAKEIADPSCAVIVAEEKPGLLIGMASGQLGRGDALRRSIRVAVTTGCFVVPPRRRRGIARRLADRVAQALVDLGAYELRLHVVAKNAASLAFWSSLGYEPVEDLLDRPTADG